MDDSLKSGSGADVASPSSSTPAPQGYATRSTPLFQLRRQPVTFEAVDHAARRMERDMQEIVQAGSRLGLKEPVLRDNLASLRSLLPDLPVSMDKMRASDWAKLLANVQHVASVLIVLKAAFPRADVSKVVSRMPKLLLLPLSQLQDDADKVKQMLARLDGEGEVDAVIEAVPYLLYPPALLQSLSNLQTWFPLQDPIELLRKNPSMLLNVEEADLPADPLYGVELHDEAS